MEQELTTISAGSLTLILCMSFLLLVLPRRYALVPLFISGCFMTLGQALIIGELHFYLIRILLFFGMIRIVVRKEIFTVNLTSIDKVLLAWLLVSSFLFVLVSGNYESLTERLGKVYNTVGMYFLIRALVRDLDDIVLAVKMLGILIIPLAFIFAVEYTTGKNMFSLFKGVAEFSEIRDGRIRCQGPFMHSILAGTFGATAMPLFVGLWLYNNRSRLLAFGAILAATFIVFASASSGPVLAYGISLLGLLCWKFRSNMRTIRRGIAVALIALQLFMAAPVWFFVSHLGDLIGGGGWYRSALIDAAVRHFNEWWLIGTDRTAHWMATGLAIDPNSADMVNYFIAQGVSGGLLALILFIVIIVKCFKTVGSAVRSKEGFSRQEHLLIWSLGCALLGHVASFFSVSYFDQITMFWYMIIAMIVQVEGARKVESAKNPAEMPAAIRFAKI